jgi:hypothetical protein
MAASFAAEFDYTAFLCGLAFLFMAGAAHVLSRQPDQRLPWSWLAGFGFGHGLYAWLDMLALSLADSPAFKLAGLALMAASFAALLEFGRRGFQRAGRRVVQRWIYLPLLAVLALGAFFGGTSGLEAACRYGLGLPGALLAGLALEQASRSAGHGQRTGLRLAALALLAYAPAAGLVVPRAAFFPASWLNDEAFLTATGFPIHVVRMLCALAAMTGVRLCSPRRESPTERPGLVRRWLFSGAFVLLAAGGWVAAEWCGGGVDVQIEQDASGKADAIAKGAAWASEADSEDAPAAWKTRRFQRLQTAFAILLVTLVVTAFLVRQGSIRQRSAPRVAGRLR